MKPMIPTRVLALALAAVIFLASAATATAACPQGTVKPGNSEVDQYQETIPGSCGNQAPGGGATGGSDDGSDGGNALPADTTRDLESMGADGVATAGLAGATAPNVEGRASAGEGDGSSGGAQGSAGAVTAASGADEDGSPLAAVKRALGGDAADGGMGLILPLILLATLVAAGLLALRRRTSA